MGGYRVQGPVVLLILDGVGSYRPYEGNAVAFGNTPFLEKAWQTYPHTLLMASAEYVGLPVNVQGNSEVGHTNLGAGRVVLQDLPRINKAIRDGTFFKLPGLHKTLEHVQKTGGDIHIMGCLSDGRVHSSIEHLKALLMFFKQSAPERTVYIHAFTDGRDAPPKSAATYFSQIDEFIKSHQISAKFATIIGRLYAMDRNFTWNYTQLAYDLMVHAKGTPADSWKKALDIAYAQGKTDEFLMPFVLVENNNPIATVKSGDALIAFNYRPDRMIQLTMAFVEDNFNGFERGPKLENLLYVGMTRYSKRFEGKMIELFPPRYVDMPLGQLLSTYDKKQLRLAESQKFPHVTYFFNGGVNTLYPGEDRIKIPSPNVPSYDLKPEMSVYEVTNTFLKKIELNIYDFYVVNFANGDMVGHSGNLEATKKAMEHMDKNLEKIAHAVLNRNGALIITADHGNAEEVINQQTGEIDTEHSIYPVPFIVVKKGERGRWVKMGKLADVAPTILAMFGIEAPPEYTGNVLI